MTEKNKEKITIVLFSIVLLMFLLLLSYKLVLFFTPLTDAQKNVFLFLDGKQNLSTSFTAAEVSHLEDVKQVMKYADYMFYILLLGFTLTIIFYRKKKDFLLNLLHLGGKVTFAVMILLGALSLISFDALFAIFHRIFFPQGNWLFAADSKIIQTFPLDFFISLSRNIFLLTLFLGILFILLGYYFKDVDSDRN